MTIKLTDAKRYRRNFLKSTVAASAVFSVPNVIPCSALGLGDTTAPSDRIHLGVIGIGPRCTYDLKAMLNFSDVRCISIADVQESRRSAGKALVDSHYGNQDCQLTRDFRELLERKDIDAVIIATGDRWHAPASIMAAEAGKDIYCEKPCGLTIEYCQRLDATIKRTGRVFQAGTQRRSVPNFIQAVQLAQTGKLGRLKTLFASVYTPSIDSTWLSAEPTPKPEAVDWNMWLGTAPWRPFNKQYVAGKWRGQWDFDSGAKLLDWGAHTLDLCQWANLADHTMPTEYEPFEKGIRCRYASGVTIVMDFLETPFANRPGWIQTMGTCPVRFVGDEGSVETGDSGDIQVSIESIQRELAQNQKKVVGLDVSAHARNFFDCMRTRKQPVANSEVMKRSHIACHAAALSWVLQRKLQIDPTTETFINDPEANGLRIRQARDWASS
ncbi:MAG: Gfo/Idh/MocA family oxidoreductase [Pirellula sp.]